MGLAKYIDTGEPSREGPVGAMKMLKEQNSDLRFDGCLKWCKEQRPYVTLTGPSREAQQFLNNCVPPFRAGML
jgi:hypothetical protein